MSETNCCLITKTFLHAKTTTTETEVPCPNILRQQLDSCAHLELPRESLKVPAPASTGGPTALRLGCPVVWCAHVDDMSVTAESVHTLILADM
jgi:hypothetical protein